MIRNTRLADEGDSKTYLITKYTRLTTSIHNCWKKSQKHTTCIIIIKINPQNDKIITCYEQKHIYIPWQEK